MNKKTTQLISSKEAWRELFRAWLMSMGVGSDQTGFRWVGRDYKCRISRIDSGLALSVWTEGGWYGMGSGINVELSGDMCDPSFDPNVVFEPIKQFLPHFPEKLAWL